MRSRALSLAALLLVLAFVGCESAGGVGGVMTTMLTGGQTTPADYRAATTDIDEPEEIELGRAVTAALGARYKLLRDESLTRYVALVGNAVALQSDRPDLKYYFGVLDTDEVNAFAAPGGYIFLTRGTLSLIRDEATLAGVLGHEVGHIALRHHVDSIKKEKQAAINKGVGVSLARLGLSFAPGVGGSVANAVVNPLLNVVADKVVEGVLRGFDRREEGEADVVGIKYAARATYDPAGLRDFLKTTQDHGAEPAVKQFFPSHPGIAERLKEQETQLKTMPVGGRRAAARFETAMAALPKPAQPAQAAPPASKPPAAKPPAQPTR